MAAKKIDVVVRQATYDDVTAITALSEKVYGDHGVLEEMVGGRSRLFRKASSSPPSMARLSAIALPSLSQAKSH
nr:hypothetical protein [uncultured Cohaesibacter sp.]